MSDTDSDDNAPRTFKRPKLEESVKGLYLESVNRSVLDFDFEKLCSVSLNNINVYACLCCGRYFQGRGPQSNAYFHSLNEDHHVFIHLETLKVVYALPDGYEVNDSSLDDIKYQIQPTYTMEQVKQLDKKLLISNDLHGKQYLPGFVGLNNIKHNDGINSLMHAMAHIQPLRNYFLLNYNFKSEIGIKRIVKSLVSRFGMLVRKIWNPKAFKVHVSPHEFIQEVSNASKKRFRLGVQSEDPIEVLSWFLNTLHKGLGGSRKANSSIIYDTFQGVLKIDTQERNELELTATKFTSQMVPFLFLSLDLPVMPLFSDEADKTTIPQVSLDALLAKYNGKKATELEAVRKRFSIESLPKYLVFCVKRFSKNNFAEEKNSTIINYPIKNLDMAPYLSKTNSDLSTKYDLLANIIYEGNEKKSEGCYKVHLVHPSAEQWFQIQDLFVDEIMAQMIILSESCIQIWKQQDI
ncbi:hypothetical protein BC833DRAFT_530919 [Globomyces pollinis-pini]|nr:hypothetical protein BC833DRAFT_530919 [Globomyces pollinis-pini]